MRATIAAADVVIDDAHDDGVVTDGESCGAGVKLSDRFR